MKSLILSACLLLSSAFGAEACPPFARIIDERENVINLLGPVDNRGCLIIIHFDKNGKEISRRFSNEGLKSIRGLEVKLKGKSVVQTNGWLYPIYGVVDKAGKFIVEPKYYGMRLNNDGTIDASLVNANNLEQRELLLVSYMVNFKEKNPSQADDKISVPNNIEEAELILKQMFTERFKEQFKHTAEIDLASNIDSICPFFIDIWKLKSNENLRLIEDGKTHKLCDHRAIIIACFNRFWKNLQAQKQISNAETRCEQ